MATEEPFSSYKHLEQMEGYRTTGYIVAGTDSSGITIGFGIDLSQPPYNTASGLKDSGFSQDFIDNVVKLDILGKDVGQLKKEGLDPSELAKKVILPKDEKTKQQQFNIVKDSIAKRTEKYKGVMKPASLESYSTLSHWGGSAMGKQQRENVKDPNKLNPYKRKAYVFGVIQDSIDGIIEKNGTITDEEYQACILLGQDSIPEFKRLSPLNTQTLNREIAFVADTSGTSVNARNYIEILDNAAPVGEKELTQEEKDQIAIDIQPTPAPLPEDVPNVLSQIEVDKENARRRQEEEKKKKEEVYQPKELVPLSDLTEEEINNLTDEERKGYGLQPTVDVVGGEKTDDELTPEQIAQIEKERLLAEEEEAEENKYSQEQLQKEKENKEKKRKQKKAENKVIDKDGDGIPDTIDADAGEPVPENQLTVSTEEQVVIEEQEKEEAVETVETEEIEVLDANGNIKKITVPTVSTPTATETETVETETVKKPKDVVEKKPELIKPRLRDFKTSGDYVRARMKYFKSIEEQGSENTLDFDNELDDDEIKEAVDMEQNSTVIDASKRNIFKTNGKSNVFNSVLGIFDDIAKGIQQELNNITKSINNKQ